MRHLLLAIALLLAGCGVLIKPAPPTPVVFRDPEGQFEVVYPGAFRPTPPKDSTVFVGKLPLITTVYDAGRLSPTVGYSTVLVSRLDAPGLPKYTPGQWVDLLIQELKKRGKVLKEAPLPQFNYQGKSVTVQAEQRGETTFTRVDYIVAGPRLYQVTLSAKRLEVLESPEFQDFFRSFRVQV
ncbi:hypothetical protein [Candidatus Cyanaurora vandensis]|uniref:hypothetical protein n=1 Tax=Candidatus Cyanaurora vandensis TaxID=2714958 RepID=UPI00257C03A8|nr:hypothetical protein [Candidatus Cyanaurora vandensis]